MKRYYIAYGSNLNVQQMRWRCPGARIIGTAELQDYRLLFKGSKTGSYLTVEPEKGCTVPVAVWEVTEQDELALDRYEGYPSFYYKTEMTLMSKVSAPASSGAGGLSCTSCARSGPTAFPPAAT